MAHVAVDLRLYDSSTGEILQSHRAVGEAKSSGFGLGGVSGTVAFGGGGFKKTPLGQATRKAIQNAVDFIVLEMEEVPWESSIIKVKADTVYISGGQDMNLQTGATYAVFGVGEELIDPLTGMCLGKEEERIGRIEVTCVEEKFSKAKIIECKEGVEIKRGDAVKLQ